ncbi:zinc ribbon domain-containing protein [Paenibacillus sp. NPDC056579]|uniref:zinc ribbon domain-containing protein n=1 Tax=Paenibacillus sp. NPDC056579 TaxID=3345871 RepID=UPI00369EC8B7
MIQCPKCLKPIKIQQKACPSCGEIFKQSVAEKFDQLAYSVEIALKKELEARKRRH